MVLIIYQNYDKISVIQLLIIFQCCLCVFSYVIYVVIISF